MTPISLLTATITITAIVILLERLHASAPSHLRDRSAFAARSSSNASLPREHWNEWAKTHIFNIERIDNGTVARLMHYAMRKGFPKDQMYDAQKEKWISQREFAEGAGLEKAFTKATGTTLAQAMDAACAAYQNGAHYTLPEGLSSDVEVALQYKMAPFTQPLSDSTEFPLRETRCVRTPDGVRIECGTDETRHRFRPNAFQELKRCVGPWPAGPDKHTNTSCARSGSKALYSGDECDVPTKLGRLTVTDVPSNGALPRPDDKAGGVGSTAPTPPVGTCEAKPSDNPYIEWQEHVVPVDGVHIIDVLQSVCAHMPACDNYAAGSEGVTCAKGRYGARCHKTFDPQKQLLDSCVASTATRAFDLPAGCRGKTGRFVVDKAGRIVDMQSTTERSLQTKKQRALDRMSDDCKCIYPFYSEKGRLDCMQSLLPGVVNDSVSGRPAGCYNPAQYGSDCQYTLTGAQTLDTSKGRAAALDPVNVHCPVQGLIWNFRRREAGKGGADVASHPGLWEGCERGACDPLQQLTGNDCDVQCPIGSEPHKGSAACVCVDKNSKDLGTSMPATSASDVDAWKDSQCSSNCNEGYVGDAKHGCIKCPPRLVARDGACFCDDPARMDHGSSFTLAAMHSGLLQQPSSEHFCKTCAPGRSGEDCDVVV